MFLISVISYWPSGLTQLTDGYRYYQLSLVHSRVYYITVLSVFPFQFSLVHYRTTPRIRLRQFAPRSFHSLSLPFSTILSVLSFHFLVHFRSSVWTCPHRFRVTLQVNRISSASYSSRAIIHSAPVHLHLRRFTSLFRVSVNHNLP